MIVERVYIYNLILRVLLGEFSKAATEIYINLYILYIYRRVLQLVVVSVFGGFRLIDVSRLNYQKGLKGAVQILMTTILLTTTITICCWSS